MEKKNQSGSGDAPTFVDVRSYYVRGRNALAVQAEFSSLYVDYYLHLMDQGLPGESVSDSLLKDALATITLHATTRPWKETHAWTLHFSEPALNVFVTAGSLLESVTGRVFTKGIRESGKSLFYAQVHLSGQTPRQSVVEIPERDVLSAVETYYRRSEQRTARLFNLVDDEVLMVSAQPGCDLGWLDSLNQGMALDLHEGEETALLETRRYRFHCGCSPARIYPAIAPIAASQGLDGLFMGEQVITIQCPRCAARWRISREQMEALMAERAPTSQSQSQPNA